MIAAYPKQLTDPEWKKVEKAGGVSGTGVGQTLRDAEKQYKALAVRLQALGAGKAKVAEVKPAQAATVAALQKSAKTVAGLLPKIKSDQKKQLVHRYSLYVDRVADELEAVKLDDHRGLDWPLDRFNDRLKMHTKSLGI